MSNKRVKTWLSSKRAYCSREGIEYSLTEKWLEAQLKPNKCAVTGITFEYIVSESRNNPFSPQIDRIKPAKGYVESNCRLVCAIYNMAKLDWSEADVLKMSRAVVAEADKQPEASGAKAYKELMKELGLANIASYLRVTRQSAHNWLARGSIPGRYAKTVEKYAELRGFDKRILCPEAY